MKLTKMLIFLLFFLIMFGWNTTAVAKYDSNISEDKTKENTKQKTVNKSIDLSTLNINLKKIKSMSIANTLHSIKRWPIKVYGLVIMDGNNNILGLTDRDDYETLWITSKKTFDVRQVIQPIKGKKFFLIFNYTYAGYYNLENNEYKVLPGKFIGLEDIDKDGLPEVMTIDKQVIRAFKIINIHTKPSMSLFVKNVEPDIEGIFRNDSDYLIGRHRRYIITNIIKFYSKDNIVLVEGRKEISPPNQYFTKWDKGGIKIKSTIKRVHGPICEGVKRYLSLEKSLTKLDKVKLLSSGMNKYGRCFVFNENYIQNSNRLLRGFSLKRFGFYNLPKLLICSGGTGYTKLSNGTLAIFDWDVIDDYILLTKKNFLDNDLILISSEKKYLVIYNLNTDQAELFLWKDILGYEPYFVKYFDGQKLVVVDNDKKINIYDVTFSQSKVKRETW